MIVNKGRDQEHKYEVEVISLRAEMAVLSQELLALRANSAVLSDSDVVLVTKCQMAEKERDELRTLLAESEKQLDSARRQIVALAIRGSALENELFILKK